MDEAYLGKLVGWLIGIIGGFISVFGILATYIFKRHVSENDTLFAQNREDHIRCKEECREFRKECTRK